jgi:hypothetical protein
MKYLKKYNKFFEDGDGGGSTGSGDATANASTSGMGAVVSAQPGALPGDTGTSGSGDIGFTFKKKKRKKGDPSEVSDMRDLEDSSDEITKLDENYSEQDVFNEVLDHLKSRNLSPNMIKQIMGSYTDMIIEMYNEGINTTQIIKKVISLLGHESEKTFLGILPPTTPKPISFL